MLNWKATILPVGAAIVASSLLVMQTAESQSGGPAFNFSHNCSFCHALHGSGGPSLTVSADVENLCQTCHGAGGVSIYKAEVHTNENERRSDYALFRNTCTTCHDPHSEYPNWVGGTNIRLVGTLPDASGLARIQTPNSGIREYVFESRGTDFDGISLHSFADGDEDGNGYYDGACEACHTEAAHHRNDDSVGGDHTHKVGRSCTNGCHTHTNYFMR